MMELLINNTYIRGWLIHNKLKKNPASLILKDIFSNYKKWRELTGQLDSENDNDLAKIVELLNNYKNYIDDLKDTGTFKLQDKLLSYVLEEFLFQLFRDIPNIKSSFKENLIFMGQAKVYSDLSFLPKDFDDFIKKPNVFINHKNQDFTIFKIVKCVFETNKNQVRIELIATAVAIECKTFITSTLLGQSIFEANCLKQGNPYALYIIVAEQNALSESVHLKNSPIDEIFILRKQKRNALKNKVKDKKPIDVEVVNNLYKFVKSYLDKDWFNPSKATERGRLIHITTE